MENTEKSKVSTRHLSIISAFMGFLGAINSMAIGFYLLSTLLNPLLIHDLMIQGYILSPIIATVTIMLTYGSYPYIKK